MKIMNFKTILVLFCTSFSLLMADESSTIENEQNNEQFAVEIVHTPVNITDVVNDGHKIDEVTVKNVENVDDDDINNNDGELPAEHDVEHIEDNEEDVASGETEHIESEAVQSVQSHNDSRAFGRSGNYQYDEFLGGLDYLGPGYDFNNGYDAGE